MAHLILFVLLGFSALASGLRKDLVARIVPSLGEFGWGTWHPDGFCPEGMWAIGLQVRDHANQGKKDDSALNAVRLLCAPLGAATSYEAVSSYEGLWGDWGTQTICADSIVAGFDLRTQVEHGSDNLGVTRLKLHCANGVVTELGSFDWGVYAGTKLCPRGSAVCGSRIQFEDEHRGDNAAMTNIEMACCKVPADSCSPKDEWRTIQSCDNRQARASVTCSYSYTVGTSKTNTQTQSQQEAQTRSATIGAQVGAEGFGLSAQFSSEVGKSVTTSHDWTTETSSTFGTSSTATESFDVPGGIAKRMDQVVGVCGPNLVYTTQTRFVEF